MRRTCAIIFALVTFVIALTIGQMALESLGIPIFIHQPTIRHWGRGGETESDGYATDFWVGLLVLAGMLAQRVFSTIANNKNITERPEPAWTYWFVGVLAYVIADIPIFYLNLPTILSNTLSAAAALGILAYLSPRYEKSLRLISSDVDTQAKAPISDVPRNKDEKQPEEVAKTTPGIEPSSLPAASEQISAQPPQNSQRSDTKKTEIKLPEKACRRCGNKFNKTDAQRFCPKCGF